MAATFLASICGVTSADISPPNNNSITGQSGGAHSIDTTGATALFAITTCTAGTSPTISDSEANTWTYSSIFGNGTSNNIRLAWCFSPTTSATHTFDFTSSADGSGQVFALGGSGTWAATAQAGSSSSQSGTSVATSSISTSSGDVVIAGIGSNGSRGTGTVNNSFSGGISGSPTAALPQDLTSGSPEVGMSAYLISGGGSIGATFTTTATNFDWTFAIGTFSLSGGGGGGGVGTSLQQSFIID